MSICLHRELVFYELLSVPTGHLRKCTRVTRQNKESTVSYAVEMLVRRMDTLRFCSLQFILKDSRKCTQNDIKSFL